MISHYGNDTVINCRWTVGDLILSSYGNPIFVDVTMKNEIAEITSNVISIFPEFFNKCIKGI